MEFYGIKKGILDGKFRKRKKRGKKLSEEPTKKTLNIKPVEVYLKYKIP